MVWEATAKFRATAPDGSVWAESSNEAEVRAAARPGDKLYRLWRSTDTEWRPVEPPTPEMADLIEELAAGEERECPSCSGRGEVYSSLSRQPIGICEKCGGSGVA